MKDPSMKTTLCLVLLASSAFASELDVPVGGRSSLTSRKAVVEVQVRDPSLLSVVTTDGAVSLEGKKSGVTGITVEYADGELERMLVVVGSGANSIGMSAEQARTVDLRQSAKAQAKAGQAEKDRKPSPAPSRASRG
jgi:hypothetical protein